MSKVTKRVTRLGLLKEQLKHAKTKKEKEIIEAKIAKSKQGKRSKEKGGAYENSIAKKFNERYTRFKLSLARTPKSGGFAKDLNNEFLCGDLTCLNTTIDFILHMECKNHKTLQMKKWIDQAKDDCVPGKVPVVVFHIQQEKMDGRIMRQAEDYITLPLRDFLDLVPGDNLISRR